MKYGFVYLWYDTWQKMYYVGRHWGTEDDGYISSSNRMRDAYRRRPQHFKRRIIKRVSTKEELVKEEQRWLDMIKPRECGKRYYNKTRKAHMPSTMGYHHSPETIAKIRQSNLGKKRSEETCEKISRSLCRPCTEERRAALSRINRTDEFRQKVSEGLKMAYANGRKRGGGRPKR